MATELIFPGLPGRILCGAGATSTLPEHIPAGRILIISDENLAHQEAFAYLQHILPAAEIHLLPNGEPHLSDAQRALDRAEAYQANIIIGLGGGSVLDTAKTVALLLGTGKAVRNCLGNQPIQRTSYLVLLPTTAGTGSESTRNCLFIDDFDGIKKAVISDGCLPDLAVLDATFTRTLPAAVTAYLKEFYDVILLHKSKDGLHWEPFDTTELLPLETRKYPNQLFELGQCGEYTVYQDDLAPEEERFKLLAIRHQNGVKQNPLESCLFTSSDGLHWTDQNISWHPSPPDLGPLSIYYNAERGAYVIATRPAMVDRRVALMETVEWRHFSKPQVVLETDALDTPICESYGITVLPYDNYYLGLYWLFHPNAEQVTAFPGGVSGKYFDGYVDAQMTASENGWYFKRGLRDPVLPNGTPGAPDCGCIYPRWIRRDSDGSILIHACIYPYEHGRWREFVHEPHPHHSIAVYRIREDGFCYYENIGGEAFLGTRALRYTGGPVYFNTQCPTGSLRVQVTDACGNLIPGYSFADYIQKKPPP